MMQMLMLMLASASKCRGRGTFHVRTCVRSCVYVSMPKFFA